MSAAYVTDDTVDYSGVREQLRTTMYLTGVSCEITREADVDELGLLVTPASSVHRQIDRYAFFGADNGRYVESKRGLDFDAERWLSWLDKLPRSTCLFACLPDVLTWHKDENGKDYCVGDLEATLQQSAEYVDVVKSMGFAVALVAQDGLRSLSQIPFAVDAIFVGGSDDYKLGDDVRALVAEARAAGLWVHVGRVNSLKRLRYAAEIGADSADGTYIGFKPSVNAPKVLGWLDTLLGDSQQQLPEVAR